MGLQGLSGELYPAGPLSLLKLAINWHRIGYENAPENVLEFTQEFSQKKPRKLAR
jgi:hypothetical protein